jgi:hypothetical protein
MELVRALPYDHPYRWNGTPVGGVKLWRPTEISTALWLDAEDASTITLNGSTVSQWNDKSGNGRNATQATAASQPTYTASAINGKPGLTWNGTSMLWLSTGAWSLAPSRQFASFAVVNLTSLSVNIDSYRRIWESNSTFSQGYLGTNSNTTSPNYLSIAGISTNTTSPIVPGTLGAGLVSSVFGTTEVGANANRVYFNGTAGQTLTGNTGALSTTGITLGIDSNTKTTARWCGSMGEIVFVSSDLTVDNRQRLEGYLAWKWGLESNLPSDHPYKNLPPTV